MLLVQQQPALNPLNRHDAHLGARCTLRRALSSECPKLGKADVQIRGSKGSAKAGIYALHGPSQTLTPQIRFQNLRALLKGDAKKALRLHQAYSEKLKSPGLTTRTETLYKELVANLKKLAAPELRRLRTAERAKIKAEYEKRKATYGANADIDLSDCSDTSSVESDGESAALSEEEAVVASDGPALSPAELETQRLEKIEEACVALHSNFKEGKNEENTAAIAHLGFSISQLPKADRDRVYAKLNPSNDRDFDSILTRNGRTAYTVAIEAALNHYLDQRENHLFKYATLLQKTLRNDAAVLNQQLFDNEKYIRPVLSRVAEVFKECPSKFITADHLADIAAHFNIPIPLTNGAIPERLSSEEDTQLKNALRTHRFTFNAATYLNDVNKIGKQVRGGKRSSALRYFVGRGDTKTVQLLLKAGAVVRKSTLDTAIEKYNDGLLDSLASKATFLSDDQKSAVLKTAIERQAVPKPDPLGRHIASLRADRAARILIGKFGYSQTRPDTLSKTPLMYALRAGKAKLAKKFFAQSSLPELLKPANNGQTVMHYAVNFDDFDISDALIKATKVKKVKSKANHVRRKKRTHKSKRGTTNKAVNKHCVNRLGKTPVHIALDKLVQLDPKEAAHKPRIARLKKQIFQLISMTTGENLDSLSNYFTNEANEVTKCDNPNTNPLILCIEHGFTDIAEALMNQGASVNIKGKLGRTPAMWAMMKGSPLFARMRGKIELHQADAFNRNYMHYLANFNRRKDILAIMEQENKLFDQYLTCRRELYACLLELRNVQPIQEEQSNNTPTGRKISALGFENGLNAYAKQIKRLKRYMHKQERNFKLEKRMFDELNRKLESLNARFTRLADLSNKQDNAGNTPAMFIAPFDKDHTLSFLLADEDIDLRTRNKQGQDIFDIAASSGNAQSLKALFRSMHKRGNGFGPAQLTRRFAGVLADFRTVSFMNECYEAWNTVCPKAPHTLIKQKLHDMVSSDAFNTAGRSKRMHLLSNAVKEAFGELSEALRSSNYFGSLPSEIATAEVRRSSVALRAFLKRLPKLRRKYSSAVHPNHKNEARLKQLVLNEYKLMQDPSIRMNSQPISDEDKLTADIATCHPLDIIKRNRLKGRIDSIRDRATLNDFLNAAKFRRNKILARYIESKLNSRAVTADYNQMLLARTLKAQQAHRGSRESAPLLQHIEQSHDVTIVNGLSAAPTVVVI